MFDTAQRNVGIGSSVVSMYTLHTPGFCFAGIVLIMFLASFFGLRSRWRPLKGHYTGTIRYTTEHAISAKPVSRGMLAEL